MDNKKKRVNLSKVDSKDKKFFKKYGQLHPINEIDNEPPSKVQIIKDQDEDSDYLDEIAQCSLEHIESNVQQPYLKLLEELNSKDNAETTPRAIKSKTNKIMKVSHADGNQSSDDEINTNLDLSENLYSKEILCKDRDETDDKRKNDPFHKHFEEGVNEKLLNFDYNGAQSEVFSWPHNGTLIYKTYNEHRHKINPTKDLDQYSVKQRIIERLNESIDKYLPENNSKLDKKQSELLNIIFNYVDFYDPCVDLKSDIKNKFIYTMHALNHVLKTRSRVISHNDKIKQNTSSFNVEHRDQGLTRPKVLILLPFKKYAFKIVQIIISLLMRKDEEFITNKKRFYEEFSDKNYDKKEVKAEKSEIISNEEFNELFSGNVDDFFRIGLSVSKKTLKLYTEFYSSDIIIASPVGLKSIIGSEEDKNRDTDFLSSIEILIVDNADILMMQNWDHVQSIFENLHLQPKKNHDVDFSRVRNYILNGYAKFYRQTMIFSSIQAPQINSIFNKHCLNYEGKIQIKKVEQIGTICQIVSQQLSQVFHKIQCETPSELPKTRFSFFTEKILPQFRDEMMNRTLVFIPSYFDYLQIRNYFKKNDISSANICEYNEPKEVDRARFLFYHGRVHFMLITERFHFYKRYKLRGVNHLIFYDLPNYPNFYANFCNYLFDLQRKDKNSPQSFSCTALYSKLDAQKLSAIVGFQRASLMINSDKNVHMFMTEEKHNK